MVSTAPKIDFLNNQKRLEPENNNFSNKSRYSNNLENVNKIKRVLSLSKKNKRSISPPSSDTSTTVYSQNDDMKSQWIARIHHLSQITQEQDNIVRHIASLHIADHVDKDDLNLTKRSITLWKKIKSFYNPTANIRRVGVPLKNLDTSIQQSYTNPALDRWTAQFPCVAPCFSKNAKVPTFLKDCILATVDKDISTEGIFRKNGNIRGLNQMCETLNTSTNEQWFDFFQQQTIVQLAAFIKRFLREMPEPLLTFKLYKVFLQSAKNDDESSIQILYYAICMLPKPNRDVVLLLLAFLNWVSRHSDVNKMDADNLARVIAPNMLYDGKTTTNFYNEMHVVSLMIQHYEKLSIVPNQLNYIESDKLPMTI